MWRFVDFLSFETQPSAAAQDEENQGIYQHRLTLRRPQSGRLEGRGDRMQLPWGEGGGGVRQSIVLAKPACAGLRRLVGA